MEYLNVPIEFALGIKNQLWQLNQKNSKRILNFDTIQANYIWGGLRVKEFPRFNTFLYVLCHICNLTRFLGKEGNGFGEEKTLGNLEVESWWGGRAYYYRNILIWGRCFSNIRSLKNRSITSNQANKIVCGAIGLTDQTSHRTGISCRLAPLQEDSFWFPQKYCPLKNKGEWPLWVALPQKVLHQKHKFRSLPFWVLELICEAILSSGPHPKTLDTI